MSAWGLAPGSDCRIKRALKARFNQMGRFVLVVQGLNCAFSARRWIAQDSADVEIIANVVPRGAGRTEGANYAAPNRHDYRENAAFYEKLHELLRNLEVEVP